MSLTIVVPKPIPPGERIEVGQKYSWPACDRCLRESSERNPVIVSPPRPSHSFREAVTKGVFRRDALCEECRLILAGKR